MEYYIMKLYQEEKKKCKEVEQGFDRYEPKTKKIVLACLVVISAACLEMVLSLLFWKNIVHYLIGSIICVISMIALCFVDNMYQKNHMEKYVDSYKKKLEILDEVLRTEFGIRTKEKLEELINIYQRYIAKKKEEEKNRKAIIVTILSTFAGGLVISFENIELIGIDIVKWISLALFLFIVVAIVIIYIYSYTYFDSLKRKYEIMIKDIRDLMLTMDVK